MATIPVKDRVWEVWQGDTLIWRSTTMNELRERAAAAIANTRGGRRGMPPITNVLDLLPANLKTEVLEDADAVLDAIGAGDLLEACKRLLNFNEQLCADVKVSTHYPSADFARQAIARAEGSTYTPPR